MFIDSVKLTLKSGNGGAGCTSFRREKFVVQGGPDGGDGGDGGDVYFEVDANSHTLANFKGKKTLNAQNGAPGMKKNMTGKRGDSLVIKVPPGTQVIDDESGDILLDLVEISDKKLILKGGKGGLGNWHFKSASNQAPEYSQKGLPGKSLNVRLELKLIADVGLVGFPNVGKSTLISVISNAKPQIANYEFTTITPKLGLVEVDEYNSFIMADIPGIIEGASDGRGLGVQFLKHIERTKVLLFMIDLANYRDLVQQYNTLKIEVSKFSELMKDKPFAIAFTRSDACDDVCSKIDSFLKEFNFENKQDIDSYDISKPFFVMPISSATNNNINDLKFQLLELVKHNK